MMVAATWPFFRSQVTPRVTADAKSRRLPWRDGRVVWSAFRGHQDRGLAAGLRRRRPGRRPPPQLCYRPPAGAMIPTAGGDANATTRVHHAHRRRGGVAARGTRAARVEAENDRIYGLDHASGSKPMDHSFPATIAR